MIAIGLTHSIAIFLLMTGLARSQSLLVQTRFTIAAAPAFFNPKADYGRNVGSGTRPSLSSLCLLESVNRRDPRLQCPDGSCSWRTPPSG